MVYCRAVCCLALMNARRLRPSWLTRMAQIHPHLSSPSTLKPFLHLHFLCSSNAIMLPHYILLSWVFSPWHYLLYFDMAWLYSCIVWFDWTASKQSFPLYLGTRDKIKNQHHHVVTKCSLLDIICSDEQQKFISERAREQNQGEFTDTAFGSIVVTLYWTSQNYSPLFFPGNDNYKYAAQLTFIVLTGGKKKELI